jgi:hypothetical protein
VSAVEAARTGPWTLARRMLPLQVGVALQGFMLWVSVEKLFQTSIGFDAASIGAVAAAYSAIIPLLEVPSGILADRWSRTGLLALASGALAVGSLLGGLSTNVATYAAAALLLGVYFALNSGTLEAVVYDIVLEETGSGELYERWIGRVRLAESLALAISALAGGVLAGWTAPRATYFATVPFALLSIVAFLRFAEPQLHHDAEPVALRRHVVTTVNAMTRIPPVRRVLLLAALTALLTQTVFEFGPLWLVDLRAPAALFGPYWAALVATLGLGGYLAAKLRLDRRVTVLPLAVALAATPVLLAVSRSLLVVALAQTVLQLLLAIITIHAGRLVNDAVPSTIRAGVSSGVGTLSWVLFLPFSLVFGAVARDRGTQWAGWVLLGTAVLLALLLVASAWIRRAVVVASGVAVDADAPVVPVVPAAAASAVPAPPDLACRQLVEVVTDYLDGVLPADWREHVDEHLAGCDGCTQYMRQIRDTVRLLARLDTTPGVGPGHDADDTPDLP